MHVGFLTPEYPGIDGIKTGGIGTSISCLARSLTKEGVKVSIFIYNAPIDGIEDREGVFFYYISKVRIRGVGWYVAKKKLEKVINTIVFDESLDLLEVPDWSGVSAWLSVKCPIILRLHGSDRYFCHLDARRSKFRNTFREARAIKSANGILAVSDFVARKTNEIFNLKKDYTVITNGVNTEEFTDDNHRSESNVILYFGTLIRKKGVFEIPKIFNEVIRQYPDAELVLVGADSPDILSGNQSTWDLIKLSFNRDAQERVSYVGLIPHSKVQDYIKDAAICIFPSFAEAFPVSWLEAMSMGKALVVSNIGWAVEMISDGEEGFLVNPTHHRLYSDRIVMLLRNRELAMHMGRMARERAIRDFDSEIIAKKNIDCYKKYISK